MDDIICGFKEFWGMTFFASKKGIGVFFGILFLLVLTMMFMIGISLGLCWLITYIRL